MERGMPDYTTLRMKDRLGAAMPNRLLPNALALSADNVRDKARAKAVRSSYEFWSTGDEALIERAFAETFAEHLVRPRREPAANGLRPCRRPTASEKDSK
jgi:hypothetical protein